MRKYLQKWVLTVLTVLIAGALVISVGHAADISKDLAIQYILATAKAARTVYVKGIIGKASAGGGKPDENWVKADHAIMLPAQYVKAIGAEIKDFELSLVGTFPLYNANAPKTAKEKEMLEKLATGKDKVVTFEDGGRYVGFSADYAIVDSCADCHNKHPKTTKKDWKKGDFMGAIVVRMR